MPLDNGETTNIFKVKAFVEKEDNPGFVNYNFRDLDNNTYLYTYTQANGADFAWLDQYDDGKLHEVYLTALNAKSSATGCIYRVLPIEVLGETTIDESYIPEFVVEYYATSSIKAKYVSDPALQLATKYSNTTHGFTDVPVTYTSSDTTALTFTANAEGVVMNALKFDDINVTITVKATYKTYEFTEDLTVRLYTPEEGDEISVADFLTLPENSECTLRGIVGPSLTNQVGFYIIADEGLVAVRLNDGSEASQILIGNEISVKGTKKHVGEPVEGTRVGQLCLDSAVLVENYGGKNAYSESAFNTTAKLNDLIDLPVTTDVATNGYRLKVKLDLVETTYYTNLNIVDPESGSEKYLGIYSSGSKQFEWMKDYYGKTVTLEFALVNWNKKSQYKAAPLAIVLEGGERVYNEYYIKAQ